MTKEVVDVKMDKPFAMSLGSDSVHDITENTENFETEHDEQPI